MSVSQLQVPATETEFVQIPKTQPRAKRGRPRCTWAMGGWI